MKKLKLEKLLKQDPKEVKELRKEELVKLSGGYTYKYTGCSVTGSKSDCTDGNYD